MTLERCHDVPIHARCSLNCSLQWAKRIEPLGGRFARLAKCARSKAINFLACCRKASRPLLRCSFILLCGKGTGFLEGASSQRAQDRLSRHPVVRRRYRRRGQFRTRANLQRRQLGTVRPLLACKRRELCPNATLWAAFLGCRLMFEVRLGRCKSRVCMVGDGTTLDVGFSPNVSLVWRSSSFYEN